MAGFSNDVVYGTNVNFSGTVGSAGKTASVTADGQLLIGATASPNIRVGALTSTGGTLAITNGPGTINLELTGGSVALQHLTGNTGGALNPDGANNINVFGNNTSDTGFATYVTGVGSTLTTRSHGTAKWIVNPTSSLGTHTTISSALTSAVSGETIFITPGTYTENLTLVAGVNLAAFIGDSDTPNVTIVGKATMTTAGTVTISGIRLQTNSDFLLAVTGSAASIVNLTSCYLNCANNTGISHSSSSSSSSINIYDSKYSLTGAVALFASTSTGNIVARQLFNTAASTTASTMSAGTIDFYNSIIGEPLTTSSTGGISIKNTNVGTGSNVISLTHGGSGTGVAERCSFTGGTQAAISVGAGATLSVNFIAANSSAANAITGAGILNYGSIDFLGTSKTMNVTTMTDLKSSRFGQVVRQVFTGSGTYTPTAGMKYCDVEVVGGGGGGGGSAAAAANQANGAGGGGGGGYSREILSAATVGASQTVTIGAAGAAGAAGNTTGGTGGTSSLGALTTATGGVGGTGSTGNNQGIGGAGGAGGSGDFNTNGSPGENGAVYTNLLGAYFGTSGAGGSTYFGGGAKGVSNATGNTALSYGGGGSGGSDLNAGGDKAGGAGFAGIVVVTEFI